MDALLMLAVGVVLPHLSLSETAIEVMALAFILSAYGFMLALAVGALVGIRGLTPKPWGICTLFFAAHLLGAAGAFVGAGVLLYGALMAL